MVAAASNVIAPFHVPDAWVAARRTSQVLLTNQNVESMVEAGVVPEDATTELLHGVLLHTDRATSGEDRLRIGEAHTICVEALSDLRATINSPYRHVRTQQPLICSDTHEPQPDFVILRGTSKGYTAKPTAANVHCVVEVADSSYERDAGEKLYGYAKAAIPQYLIINLRNRTAEVYERPDPEVGTYVSLRLVGDKENLSIRSGIDDQFNITLSTLLP